MRQCGVHLLLTRKIDRRADFQRNGPGKLFPARLDFTDEAQKDAEPLGKLAFVSNRRRTPASRP